MASHEELITELPKLDKLSNAARLKHAKKRRLKQIKKYQEWVRQQRALSATASTAGGSVMKKSRTTRIVFEDGSILNDMVSRNELTEGEGELEGGAEEKREKARERERERQREGGALKETGKYECGWVVACGAAV